MQRLGRVFLFTLFLLILALAGCGSNNPSIGAPNKITITPSGVSLNRGQVQQVAATVTDTNGNVISTETVTFTTSDPFTVGTSPSGSLCAGTWDSSFIHCAPGPVGSATITATASPSKLTTTAGVFVHQPADSVVVGLVSAPPACGVNPPPPASCVSKGATAPANTASYTAIACSNDPAICAPGAPPCQLPQNTLGPFTFSTTDPTVVTAAPDTVNPNTVAVATATGPGVAQITATLSGTSSLSATFVTCPPASISIHVPSQPTQTTVSVAKGSTGVFTVDALDTNGIAITGIPVTWNSSQTAAVTVAAGVVTGVDVGTSNIVAACAPPSCNPGTQQAIYSNVGTATITGTANNTTVYATSSDAGTTTMLPINTSDFSVGTAINLPSGFPPPNSFVFAPSGLKAFLGTDSGLEIFDVATSTFVTVAAVKGKVLAVSADGNQVVVVDTTLPSTVYQFSLASNSLQSFTITGATAAGFTPDGSRLFVGTSGGRVYEIATGVFANNSASGPLTGISLLASGAFAYAADPNTDLFSTCTNVSPGSAGTPTTLIRAAALPLPSPNNTQLQMIGIAPPNAVQIDVVTTTGLPCPPLPTNTIAAHDFGVGPWDATKSQLLISPDSTHAVVTTPDVAKFLDYVVNVSAPSGTTIVAALGGAATGTYTGGITLDSTNAYLGVAGINEVQVFKLADGSLVKQIPLAFSPKLVAVRPF